MNGSINLSFIVPYHAGPQHGNIYSSRLRTKNLSAFDSFPFEEWRLALSCRKHQPSGVLGLGLEYKDSHAQMDE